MINILINNNNFKLSCTFFLIMILYIKINLCMPACMFAIHLVSFKPMSDKLGRMVDQDVLS